MQRRSSAPGSWTKPYEIGAAQPQLAAWGGKYVYAASDESVYVSSNNCGSWTNEGYNNQMSAEPWIWVYGPNV
jgi:hypothetical protein